MKGPTPLEKLQAAAEGYTPDAAFLRSLAAAARTKKVLIDSLRHTSSDEHLAEQVAGARKELGDLVAAQDLAVRAAHDASVAQARRKYTTEQGTPEKAAQMGLLRDRAAAAAKHWLTERAEAGDMTREEAAVVGAELRNRGMDDIADGVARRFDLSVDPWMDDPLVTAAAERVDAWTHAQTVGNFRVYAGLETTPRQMVPIGEGYVSVDDLIGGE